MNNASMISMATEDGFAKAYDEVVELFIKQGRTKELPQYIREKLKEPEKRVEEEVKKKAEIVKIEDVIESVAEFDRQLAKKITEMSHRFNIYQLKFNVGYLVGYLEDYLAICETPCPRNLTIK
jgi:tripartite-type tricarboxylate transporter receptor subunit TctC